MKREKLVESEINLLKRMRELESQFSKIGQEGRFLNAQFWKELQDRIGYKAWKLNNEKMEVIEMTEEEIKIRKS